MAIENSCSHVMIVMILIRQEKVQQIERPCFSVSMEPHAMVSLVLIPILCILGTFTPMF